MTWELGMWVSPAFLTTALWPPWLVGRSAWGWLDATCNNHQPSATQNHNPCWYSWSDSDYQRFQHGRDLNSWRQEHLWLRILLHLGSRWPCRPVETTISRCEELLGCSLTREPGTILCKLCWSPRYPGCIQSQQLCLRSNFYGFACSLCQNIWGTSGVTWTPFFFTDLGGAPVRRTKPCLGGWQWRYFLSRLTEPYMAWRNNWCPIEHHYLYLHGIWG